MIVKIEHSPIEHKRFRVIMDNGKKYDFGLDGGQTYIDHHNKTIKKNYWKRHFGNEKEKRLITNLVPSPSLFSALLLWGESTSLEKKIQKLNQLLKIKHSQ